MGVLQSELIISNLGRSAEINATITTGDHATRFAFDASSVACGIGGQPVEIRLLHHGRVLDSMPGCEATLHTTGLQLGAGTSNIQAEAIYADGMRVRSAPIQIDIDYDDGTPSNTVASVSTSTVWIGDATEAFVMLPNTHDDRNDTPTFAIIDAPAQATIAPGPDGPYRLLNPDPGATGFDVMTYRVTNAAGQSSLGRVVLVYDRHPLDITGDGSFDIDDLYAIHAAPADINYDGIADAADIRDLETLLRCGELPDMSDR